MQSQREHCLYAQNPGFEPGSTTAAQVLGAVTEHYLTFTPKTCFPGISYSFSACPKTWPSNVCPSVYRFEQWLPYFQYYFLD